MPPQRVGTCKPSAATPIPAGAELALADEFLFPGMEAFVALTVMLTRKCLATYGAHKRAFIRMGTEMGAQVVRPSKAFRAECALKGSGMFLNAFVHTRRRWPGRIGELQDVIAIGNG